MSEKTPTPFTDTAVLPLRTSPEPLKKAPKSDDGFLEYVLEQNRNLKEMCRLTEQLKERVGGIEAVEEELDEDEESISLDELEETVTQLHANTVTAVPENEDFRRALAAMQADAAAALAEEE